MTEWALTGMARTGELGSIPVSAPPLVSGRKAVRRSIYIDSAAKGIGR